MPESNQIERKQAERFLLFCMLVAGKRSEVQDEKLRDFLSQSCIVEHEDETYTLRPRDSTSPFEWVRTLDAFDVLEETCRKHKLGKYSTIVPGFRQLAHSGIDILDTDEEELREVRGIGPKTAKYYLMRTGQIGESAALDTHILAWLQEQGYDAPDGTPSGAEYDRLQDIFVEEAERRGLTPSELDARIWNDRSESDLEAKSSLS